MGRNIMVEITPSTYLNEMYLLCPPVQTSEGGQGVFVGVKTTINYDVVVYLYMGE